MDLGRCRLPACPLDFTPPTDVARHDRMVAVVECTAEGVDLHKKLAAEQAPHIKTALRATPKAETTDRQIDQLVYALTDYV